MFTFEWYVWFLEKAWFFIAVILYAGLCTELQNPIVFKPCQSFSRRRCPLGRMRDLPMQSCQSLTHRLRRSPLSHRRGLSSLILDSATSPFGFAQNDKDGFSNDRDYYLLKVKYSQWPWLISDGENMNTSTVRYIWRWVLMKLKKTLYL